MIKFLKNVFKNMLGRPRYTGSSSPNDYYNNLSVPGKYSILREYKKVVYTCANINAERCASIPFKLYVTTGNGQQKARVETKSLKSFETADIKTRFSLRSDIIVEEVTEHPLLDLLKNPSGDNYGYYCTGYELRIWTELFIQLNGVAYWRIYNNILGIPSSIEFLPSYLVEPQKLNDGIDKPVDYYIYYNPYTKTEEIIKADELIIFKNPNLYQPYSDGTSDLAAAYEQVTIGNKIDSVKNGILDNNGVPSHVISPKTGDNAWGSESSRRFERELSLRFSRGKSGGFFVTEDPIDIEKIGLDFKELSTLELDERTITIIANVFRVPISFLINKTVNKATLEAALTQLALLSINPRLYRQAAVLNTYLVPRYDTTGRLFIAFDSPIPEDKTQKLQENVQLCMNGIKTPNEARDEYGLPPLPDGDTLRPINVSPEIVRQEKRDDGTAKQ